MQPRLCYSIRPAVHSCRCMPQRILVLNKCWIQCRQGQQKILYDAAVAGSSSLEVVGAANEGDSRNMVNHHRCKVSPPDFPEHKHANAGNVEAQLCAVVRLHAKSASTFAAGEQYGCPCSCCPITTSAVRLQCAAEGPGAPVSIIAEAEFTDKQCHNLLDCPAELPRIFLVLRTPLCPDLQGPDSCCVD